MAVYFDKYLPIQRMSTAQRTSRTWSEGMLIYDNDLETLYEGDGATAGGGAAGGSGGSGGASAQAPVASPVRTSTSLITPYPAPVSTPDGGL